MKWVAVTAIIGILGAALAYALWPDDEPPPSAAVEVSAPPPRETPPPAIADTATSTGHVTGLVHRRGTPVSGATVVLKGAARDATTSGADGRFAFTVATAGDYLLSATAGAAEASDVVGPLRVSLDIPVDVSLELLPAASLRGVVKDARTLQPIAEATIASSAGTVRTDRAGRFALEGLPASQTWLEVSATGYFKRSEWLGLLAAREHSGLEVLLQPAAVLSGTVTRGGVPAVGAQVWAETEASERVGTVCGPTVSTVDGGWSLECQQGPLQLAAAAQGGTRVEGPRVQAEPTRARTGIDIELGQALPVDGTVSQGESRLAGATLTLIDARGGRPVGGTISAAQGRFHFDDVPVGHYVMQVQLGALNANAGPLEQTGEGTPWAVVVDGSRVLKGRVDPAQAGVRVRWRSGEQTAPLEIGTDEKGAFRFEGVSPGTLLIDAEGPGGTAQANAKAGDEVVLTLSKSSLTVTAVDEKDHPVGDYLLELISFDSGEVRRVSVLSPDGRVKVPLPKGPWQAYGTANGHGNSAYPRVEVRGEAEVKLVLPSVPELRFFAFDEKTRAPLSGVETMFSVFTPGRYHAPSRRVGPFVSSGNGEIIASGVPGDAWVSVRRGGKDVLRAPVDKLPRDAGGRREIPVPSLDGSKPPPATPPEVTEYEGIGAQLSESPGRVFIWQTFPGSPAEAAGLLHGDTIVQVDGSPVAPPVNAVIQRIVGPSGSLVTLNVVRNGRPLEFTLRRRAIRY